MKKSIGVLICFLAVFIFASCSYDENNNSESIIDKKETWIIQESDSGKQQNIDNTYFVEVNGYKFPSKIWKYTLFDKYTIKDLGYVEYNYKDKFIKEGFRFEFWVNNSINEFGKINESNYLLKDNYILSQESFLWAIFFNYNNKVGYIWIHKNVYELDGNWKHYVNSSWVWIKKKFTSYTEDDIELIEKIAIILEWKNYKTFKN